MKTSDPDITSIPSGRLGASYIQVCTASIKKMLHQVAGKEHIKLTTHTVFNLRMLAFICHELVNNLLH